MRIPSRSQENERKNSIFIYWPGLQADVINHCNQCEPCSQHARLRVTDRVLITEIERPDLPGAHLMMDGIGPIDPPSAQGHKYLLCTIDVYAPVGHPSTYLTICQRNLYVITYVICFLRWMLHQ